MLEKCRKIKHISILFRTMIHPIHIFIVLFLINNPYNNFFDSDETGEEVHTLTKYAKENYCFRYANVLVLIEISMFVLSVVQGSLHYTYCT